MEAAVLGESDAPGLRSTMRIHAWNGAWVRLSCTHAAREQIGSIWKAPTSPGRERWRLPDWEIACSQFPRAHLPKEPSPESNPRFNFKRRKSPPNRGTSGYATFTGKCEFMTRLNQASSCLLFVPLPQLQRLQSVSSRLPTPCLCKSKLAPIPQLSTAVAPRTCW